MIALAAMAAAGLFALALRQAQVAPVAAGAFRTTATAARAARDAALTDAEKEQLLRRASLSLLGAFVSITARTALAVAAAALPLLALQAAGLLRLAAVGQWLTTWSGSAITGGVITTIFLVRNRS